MQQLNVGRVLVCHGAQSVVEDEAEGLHQCRQRRRLESRPLCGDRVLWRPTSPGEGVIEAVQPRSTLLTRGDFRNQPKATAANVDRMVVVLSAEAPDRDLLDRYLALAVNLGIGALAWVNKLDLLSGSEVARLMEGLDLYPGLDCPVLGGSASQAIGLEALQAELAGHVAVLVGASGVGKSSLVNALVPDLDLRIGALSEASGLGRHTTTATTLFHLPGGGDLIDSPGIRALRLGHLSPGQIEIGFPEIARLRGDCQYRDCRHHVEPGCAVRAAAAAGAIDGHRLESFQRLLREQGEG